MRSVQTKVDELLKLPWRNEYRITEIPTEEGGGLSICIPLLGANLCVGDGETFEEAETQLLDVLELTLTEWVLEKRNIPRPRSAESFSGKFLVRTTPSLHERLMKEAEGTGVSLNYLVGLLLERGLAGRALEPKPADLVSAPLKISSRKR